MCQEYYKPQVQECQKTVVFRGAIVESETRCQAHLHGLFHLKVAFQAVCTLWAISQKCLAPERSQKTY